MFSTPSLALSATRESERRYRAYFQLPLVGIGVSDPEKRWIDVNDKLCDILGYSREEILQLAWTDVTHPDDLAKDISLFDEVLAAERDGYSLEKRFIHKSGRTVHTLLSARCLRNKQGAVESFVVAVDDISRRKRAEMRHEWSAEALSALASGKELERVLDVLARGFERFEPTMVCSVWVLEEDGKHLRLGAAPSLSDELRQMMDGLLIGPDSECCGVAAYLGKQVIVHDITTDPFCSCFHGVAEKLPGRACWALPIHRPDGNVVGTLLIFHAEPRTPTDEETDLIDYAADLAGIAIGQRQREEEVRRSEKRYRRLFERAPSGILVEDADGHIVDVNPRICEMLRVTRDELIGQHIGSLTTVGNDVVAWRLRAIASGRELSDEVVNRRSDGSQIHLAIREVPFPLDDGSIGVLVISHDITRRKMAEEGLKKSEERFRTLTEHVQLIPLEADPETLQISYVGPQGKEILGFPMSEWLKPGFWLDRVHPEDRAHAFNFRKESIHERSDYDHEYRVIKADGSVIWMRELVHVVCEDGRPTKLQGFLIDITDRRSAEQRVRELEVEMSHAARLSTIGELTTGIAHELNQPLFAISNFASACRNQLERDAADPQAVRRMLDDIVEQSQRAGQTLKRILSFVRKESPHRSTVDVTELIADSVSLIEFEARRRRITPTVQIEPGLPPVLVDRVQIQQVLVNLLQNACEATAELGIGPNEVCVDIRLHEDDLVIEVLDTGPGIAKEHLAHVFDPFFTTKPEGVGIGLAVSQTIVEAHDGRLEVSNRAGGGAVFRVTIPCRTPPPPLT